MPSVTTSGVCGCTGFAEPANVVLEALGRRDRKGAHDTFDGSGYANLLQLLHRSSTAPGQPGATETVYAPENSAEKSRNPSVGSSMMMTRLPNAAERTTATPWRCPPDRVSTWVTDLMPIFRSARCAEDCDRIFGHVESAEHGAHDAFAFDFPAEEHVGGDVQGGDDGDGVTPLADLGMKHGGIAHTVGEPFVQVWLERIQHAGPHAAGQQSIDTCGG